MDIAALAQKASALCPMDTSPVAGRVLLIDGDALAYYCAGNDDTSIEQARINVRERVSTASKAACAEEVFILVTMPGSPKGDRYAIARCEPYQGQRTGSNRPKNWEYIRQMLNSTAIDYASGKAVVWHENYFEADDIFKRMHDTYGPENIVILTQDKDMRMIPGLHMDWRDYSMFRLGADVWHAEHNGKVYGRSWFWHQMMHGDDADNIPGIPWYTDGSVYKSGPKKGHIKRIPVGKKAAILERIPEIGDDARMCEFLLPLYQSCYEDYFQALCAMMEQGILLWLRSDPNKFDVAAPGNPLAELTMLPEWPAITHEFNARVAEIVYAQA